MAAIETTHAVLAALGIELDWLRALTRGYLFRFMVPAAVLMGLWCRPPGMIDRISRISQDIAGLLLAVAVTRLMVALLPFRPRPMIVDPGRFGAVDVDVAWATDWSSLPSDHAALGAAIVVIIWRHAPRWGAVAAAWVLLVVCMPRIAVGLHDGFDILAGLAVGGATATLAAWLPIPAGIGDRLRRQPVICGAVVFLMLFQVSTLFDEVRRVAKGLAELVR